jgi:hypothetical protein
MIFVTIFENDYLTILEFFQYKKQCISTPTLRNQLKSTVD